MATGRPVRSVLVKVPNRRIKTFERESALYLYAAECGRTTVEEERNYEMVVNIADGEIRNVICSCTSGTTHKQREVAMLQLREKLALISKHYVDLYHGYFTVVVKSDLLHYAIDSQQTGSFSPQTTGRQYSLRILMPSGICLWTQGGDACGGFDWHHLGAE